MFFMLVNSDSHRGPAQLPMVVLFEYFFFFCLSAWLLIERICSCEAWGSLKNDLWGLYGMRYQDPKHSTLTSPFSATGAFKSSISYGKTTECKDLQDSEASFFVKIKRMRCPLWLDPLNLEHLTWFVWWAVMITQSPLWGWGPHFD